MHSYIARSLTQLAILSSTVDGRKNFFSLAEVIKWFNKENGTSFSLSTELFGKLPNEFNPNLPPLMLKKLNYVFFVIYIPVSIIQKI